MSRNAKNGGEEEENLGYATAKEEIQEKIKKKKKNLPQCREEPIKFE